MNDLPDSTGSNAPDGDTPDLELNPNPRQTHEYMGGYKKGHNDGCRVGQWQLFEIIMATMIKSHPKFFKKWFRKNHDELAKRYLETPPKQEPALPLTKAEIAALRKIASQLGEV